MPPQTDQQDAIAPPKRVEFEGTTHEFPADFSDADISKALAAYGQPAKAAGGMTPPPTGKVGAPRFQPGGRIAPAPGADPNRRVAAADDPTLTKKVIKGMATTAGSVLAPELLGPEVGMLGRAALSGTGAAVGTSAGQAATGENPLSKPSLKEAGTTGLVTSAADLFFGAFPALVRSKVGRSFINESLGATARDVTYGNPAKALEDVHTPWTGDIEKFKTALRAGKPLAEAEAAAGGRFGAISQKIETLTPRLNALVGASRATVPTADAIDRPLLKIINDVANNPAITATDKNAIVNQLSEFEAALHQGRGATLSMQEALAIKRAVGNEVSNWLTPPRNEIQEAYRDVYRSLKNAVHANVPGSADLDEKLTDAISAKDSLEKLARAEEVSRGTGMMRSNMGVSWFGKLESVMGRALPAAGAVGEALRLASKALTYPAVTSMPPAKMTPPPQ